MYFLWLCFLGGLFELLLKRLMAGLFENISFSSARAEPGWRRQSFGFLWVVFFFYVTAQPSVYPFFKPLDHRPKNLIVNVRTN